jgi:hypothetical protein
MQKIIELESTYTPYTLDTYHTFTFESDEDYILEILNDEKSDEADEITYDDVDWDYNTDGYLKDLAEKRVELMNDEILDDVILKVESKGEIVRPAYYNFTTDRDNTYFTVDIEKLEKYISGHKEDYEKNKIQSCGGFMWLGDEEQTMLNYYLMYKSADDDKGYTRHAYVIDQYDCFSPYEYIDYKLIDKTTK